jgi:hypothetical protein
VSGLPAPAKSGEFPVLLTSDPHSNRPDPAWVRSCGEGNKPDHAKGNRNVLYLRTDLGMFASTDGGASWTVLGGGLPTCPVIDLAAHSESGTLVAVTHGLSAFALEVASVSDAEGE